MAYPARVYRVLIAAPSDVSEEREVAVRVIREWNDQNSPDRQLVLLPLRWETHSAPEYGKRPQDVINRQVVDHSDLLIGIFWTRIGSPTGNAESGTLKEIDRVAKGGKPVMLYFSDAKQNPSDIDLDQLGKLRDFRNRTYPKALVERYSNIIEFRDKLAKQVEIQIRSLVAEDTAATAATGSSGPLTDIQLHFADLKTGAPTGDSITAKTIFLTVSDFGSIPDYKAQQESQARASSYLSLTSNANINYYREKVTYLIQGNFFRPIRFWLKNTGQIGARDVYVDLTISSAGDDVVLLPATALPTTPPSKMLDYYLTRTSYAASPEEFLSKAKGSWSTYFEVSALQPKREISAEPKFLIGALRSRTVKCTANIYADTLSEPLVRELTLNLEVKPIVFAAKQLIDDFPKPELPTGNGSEAATQTEIPSSSERQPTG